MKSFAAIVAAALLVAIGTVNGGEIVIVRVPEIVTLGRFPGGGESDSRWRTKEVRHVGSDTLTAGF